MARRLGGGSLSLLQVLAGVPARGEVPLSRSDAALERYQHLTEAQRSKLVAALSAAQADARLSGVRDGCMRTEVCAYALVQPFLASLLRKATGMPPSRLAQHVAYQYSSHR